MTKEVMERANNFLQKAKSFMITTDGDYVYAAELVKDIKEKEKKVKEHYGPMKEAAQKAHKEICTQEKRYLTPLGEAEKIYKSKMGAWTTEQERIAREKMEKAEKKGEPVIVQEPVKVEGVSYMELWDFELVDISKVPDEYKMLDEKKVRGVVRAMKGETNIPGIKVFSKKVPRVTS